VSLSLLYVILFSRFKLTVKSVKSSNFRVSFFSPFAISASEEGAVWGWPRQVRQDLGSRSQKKRKDEIWEGWPAGHQRGAVPPPAPPAIESRATVPPPAPPAIESRAGRREREKEDTHFFNRGLLALSRSTDKCRASRPWQKDACFNRGLLALSRSTT
jgi:hypothetical protein